MAGRSADIASETARQRDRAAALDAQLAELERSAQANDQPPANWATLPARCATSPPPCTLRPPVSVCEPVSPCRARRFAWRAFGVLHETVLPLLALGLAWPGAPRPTSLFFCVRLRHAGLDANVRRQRPVPGGQWLSPMAPTVPAAAKLDSKLECADHRPADG